MAIARQKQLALAIEMYCNRANARQALVSSMDDIAPAAAVALLALIRTSDRHGDGALSPVAWSPVPFAPTVALAEDLLTFLHDDGLIWIDPTSHADAFVEIGDSVTAFRPIFASWSVTSMVAYDVLREVETLALQNRLPGHWMVAAIELHSRLATAECRAYFDKCLKDRGLPRNSSPRVEALIENLLCDFSPAQVFRIIWCGARDTVDFLARKQVNRAHAANYSIGACQRWADRARTNAWDVKGFKRPFDLPRSMLGYVLHDVILKVGDDGFERPISELLLHRV